MWGVTFFLNTGKYFRLLVLRYFDFKKLKESYEKLVRRGQEKKKITFMLQIIYSNKSDLWAVCFYSEIIFGNFDILGYLSCFFFYAILSLLLLSLDYFVSF